MSFPCLTNFSFAILAVMCCLNFSSSLHIAVTHTTKSKWQNTAAAKGHFAIDVNDVIEQFEWNVDVDKVTYTETSSRLLAHNRSEQITRHGFYFSGVWRGVEIAIRLMCTKLNVFYSTCIPVRMDFSIVWFRFFFGRTTNGGSDHIVDLLRLKTKKMRCFLSLVTAYIPCTRTSNILHFPHFFEKEKAKQNPCSRIHLFHLCFPSCSANVCWIGTGDAHHIDGKIFLIFVSCVGHCLAGPVVLSALSRQSFRRLQSTFALCWLSTCALCVSGDGDGFYRRLHCHNANAQWVGSAPGSSIHLTFSISFYKVSRSSKTTVPTALYHHLTTADFFLSIYFLSNLLRL